MVKMGDAQISRDLKQEETAMRGGGVGGRARVRLQQGGRGGDGRGGGAASFAESDRAAADASEEEDEDAAYASAARGAREGGAGLGEPLDESALPDTGAVDLG